MQLFCKRVGADLMVLAVHDDADPIPAETYGAGIVVLPYAGSLGVVDLIGRPAPAIDLRAYADGRLSALSVSEITVNLGTKTKPIPISAATDATGRTAVLGMLAAYREGLKAEGDTTRWYQSAGAVDLTQAQLVTIGGAVLGHGDGVFACWQRAVQAVADGEARNIADVDALFAPLAAA